MKNKAKVMQLIGMALMMEDVGVNIHPNRSICISIVDSSAYQIMYIAIGDLHGALEGIYWYTADEAINLLKFIAENGRAS